MFEARRAAYIARYCAIVRDDPPPRVMGAALVAAVTALLAAGAAAPYQAHIRRIRLIRA